MAQFFKTSTYWVIDYRYEGRPRRWFKAFGPGVDVAAVVGATLNDWYGSKAQLVAVRPATDDEELAYLRGDEPKNSYCPTDR
jgi:hypothetical protein